MQLDILGCCQADDLPYTRLQGACIASPLVMTRRGHLIRCDMLLHERLDWVT